MKHTKIQNIDKLFALLLREYTYLINDRKLPWKLKTQYLAISMFIKMTYS